ncbi:MAG: undecaprenyl-diphosphate phosphatase, partial [Candidatus Methanomethylicia archaeon]
MSYSFILSPPERILSLVQGITEWFPISSSGHLVLFQEVFNIKVS